MTTANTSAAGADSLLRHSVFSLFVAGFISVIVFQMGASTILQLLGMPAAPFPMGATKPLGVPQLWSLAFWGGIWGIVFGFAEKHFPSGVGYWIAAILFGAIFPTAVLWFVVFPLKGVPMAAGWDATRMTAQVINHATWGLGTALLLCWHNPHRA
jgi:hypothetical protein